MSPNKKDVTCKHIGPKQYEVHATHFLLESQVGFYFYKLYFTFQGANNNLFDN
jgi:hypothetical protein